MCVCVRERVREREGWREGGGGRERERGDMCLEVTCAHALRVCVFVCVRVCEFV